jgi:hypothetical protein
VPFPAQKLIFEWFFAKDWRLSSQYLSFNRFSPLNFWCANGVSVFACFVQSINCSLYVLFCIATRFWIIREDHHWCRLNGRNMVSIDFEFSGIAINVLSEALVVNTHLACLLLPLRLNSRARCARAEVSIQELHVWEKDSVRPVMSSPPLSPLSTQLFPNSRLHIAHGFQETKQTDQHVLPVKRDLTFVNPDYASSASEI